MGRCTKHLSELSAKIKGCFPWVLVLLKSALSVETCELLRCPAALHVELHDLLGNIFNDIWRAELGVAVLWDSRVSVEVSGTDLIRASEPLLSAARKQMGSCII